MKDKVRWMTRAGGKIEDGQDGDRGTLKRNERETRGTGKRGELERERGDRVAASTERRNT